MQSRLWKRTKLTTGITWSPRACLGQLETFTINVERILSEPGPVFAWLKVRPEVENQPIGARSKWRTRSQVQVVADLKKELGIT